MLLAGLLLASCAGHGVNTAPVGLPAPASSDFAAAASGALLPRGVVVGLVARLSGTDFAPAPGVVVTLQPGDRQTTTDNDGHYRFSGVAAGTLTLRAQASGTAPIAVTAHLGDACGLARINLPLVESSATLGLAGVLCDPRGCALPSGSVHEVDTRTPPGNRELPSDSNGFFAQPLGGDGATLELQGHGTTPGGLHVESTQVTTLAARGTVAVQVTADAFAAPQQARVLQVSGGVLRLAADGLPTRPDELSLALSAGDASWTLAPTQLASGEVDVALPAGARGAARVSLRPFDRDPPSGPVALDFTIGP